MRFSDRRQKERWFHIHDQSAFDGSSLASSAAYDLGRASGIRFK
jgi:hypothetical protein